MAAKRRRGFGSIVPERSGRFTARYADPEGRTKVTKHGNVVPVLHKAAHTFDTREDAEAWLSDERRLISAGAWTPPDERRRAAALAAANRSTFEDYARAWLDGRHDLRPTTRTSYTTALTKHLLPAFGPLPLEAVTVAAVRAWFGSYGERTPTARAHAYQVLSSIMRQAEDDELIERNPCRIKAGGRTKTKREPEILTRAELFALADAMPDQYRALTLVAGLCGLRFGEAVALRRRDVDLEARVLHVRRTATRVDGAMRAGPPKTAAGRRDVTMPRSVAEAVREHLATLPVAGRDALVFPGRDGNLLSPTTLYGRTARVETAGSKKRTRAAYGFFAAREAIGRPSLLWHDLRRTAATLAAAKGATAAELQSRFGWTTGEMALHYQQATAERDRALADALDGPDEHDDVRAMRAEQ